MANLFSDAHPGDKFRNRDGQIVRYRYHEDGFYYVTLCDSCTDEYGVHLDGRVYHGTGNGVPMISCLDIIEKIE